MRKKVIRQNFHLNELEEMIKEPYDSGKHGRCIVHNRNTHTISNCQVYAEKSSEEKVEPLKIKRAYLFLLKIGHLSVDCTLRKK